VVLAIFLVASAAFDGLIDAVLAEGPRETQGAGARASVQYDAIRYVPEGEDPSLSLETKNLVAKIIDNTGLLLERNVDSKSYFGRYGVNSPLPFSHHLGYHGIRTLYDKQEKRNLVIPGASWLNLQGVRLAGIENDPVDERAWAGAARGWPMRIERAGAGARLTLDPMPKTQFGYTIEFQPSEPDALDFSIRFVFKRKPTDAPARFTGSWPCYVNAYDDVRFFYPKGSWPDDWTWASLGEKPDIIIGEPVGYKHQQTGYTAQEQAVPIGYGRIGEMVLILMFNDPRVTFFVVNAGGHLSFSPVQNPAWDFRWVLDDYPLGEPVGFDGRLVYTRFESQEAVVARYREWLEVGN